MPGNSARAQRLLALHRTMLRIRAFEDAAEEASRGGVAVLGQQVNTTPAHVRGPLHLSTGQEAVAAGVCVEPPAGRLPHLDPPWPRPHDRAHERWPSEMVHHEDN